jgi:hypothetical protein
MDDTAQRKSLRLSPLHAVSGAIMICSDWLMYAMNLLLGGKALLATTLGGSLLCGACVLGIEHMRAGDRSWRIPAQKALVAGLAVALPLPIVGASLGAVALIWALMVSNSAPHPGART